MQLTQVPAVRIDVIFADSVMQVMLSTLSGCALEINLTWVLILANLVGDMPYCNVQVGARLIDLAVQTLNVEIRDPVTGNLVEEKALRHKVVFVEPTTGTRVSHMPKRQGRIQFHDELCHRLSNLKSVSLLPRLLHQLPAFILHNTAPKIDYISPDLQTARFDLCLTVKARKATQFFA